MNYRSNLTDIRRDVDDLRARIEARMPHRTVEIVDGGTVPWPGTEREPWDGEMPERILVVGVLPREGTDASH